MSAGGGRVVFICATLRLGMIMSDFVPNNESVVPTTAPKPQLPSASIWLRELPYAAVLILTLLGVAYTSFTKTTDDRLLGISCACDGGRLYLERLALRAR